MFNAGLLVINRRRWLEAGMTERAMQLAIENGDKGGDQMTLNTLLHDDWVELDPRWNQCHDMFFWARARAAGLSRAQWRQCSAEPFIIHYTGHAKPWSDPQWKPRYAEFFHYLNGTAYASTIPRGRHLDDLLGPAVYFWLWLVLRALYRVVRRGRAFLAPRSFTPAGGGRRLLLDRFGRRAAGLPR